MGAFYHSILVRSETTNQIQNILEQVAKDAGCSFYLGPSIGGWVSIFPEDSSEEISQTIAAQLSLPILDLSVHDDGFFTYNFYRQGKLVDAYNSCPDYFGEISDEEKTQSLGRPECLQEFLAEPGTLPQLKSLLSADKENYVFESQRLEEFVTLLGLPNAIGSYDYLESGEDDNIEDRKKFIHLQGAEKPKPQITGEMYDATARIKRSQGDVEGALADFDMAIQVNPGLAPAYNSRGLIKYNKGNYAEALPDYDKAIELDPQFAVAYVNRGEVKRAVRDWDGAMADFDRAIAINPQMEAPFNNRAEVKKATGDIDGALVDLNRAIELKSDSATLHNNRGDVRRRKGDAAGALADFDRAIELDPKSAAAYNNRGLTKQEKGDLEGALNDFNRSLEIQPLAFAYNNRGTVRHIRGDADGAMADFDQAVRLNPNQPDFCRNRSEARLAKGDLDGALADAQKALLGRPDWAEAHGVLGEIQRRKGDLDSAMVNFNKATELKPNHPVPINGRALIKLAKGDSSGALIDINRALELAPKSAQVYSNRGRIKESLGDTSGARLDYQKALELNPKFADARKYLDALDQTAAKTPPPPAEEPDPKPLAIRTDFSNEKIWKSLCKIIRSPENEFGFEADVEFVSDKKYACLTTAQIIALLSQKPSADFVFVIDSLALTGPDHPVLVIDLQTVPGRTFRVVTNALWEVENNLSTANMNFEDFANAVDKAGIYRGIDL